MVPNVASYDDVPLEKDNPPAPAWVTEGVFVVHDTFGRGVVRRVGLYKRLHTVWIEFDEVGVKALSPKYAIAHLRRAEPGTAAGDPSAGGAARFGPWADLER
jgi:hypothetical protein